MPIQQFDAKIISNKKITPDYYLLNLDVPSNFKNAQPGQFMHIKINNRGDILLRRPLSIHRISPSRQSEAGRGKQKTENRGQIEILYEVVGRGTQVLAQKRAGEYLNVIGPLGRGFEYGRNQKSKIRRQILVAGGMGVAPLIFLQEKLKEIKNQKSKIKNLVLIGAKTKSHILCEEEFRDLDCEVKIATEDGSKGFKGRVTDLLKNLLSTRYSLLATNLYACGPKPMLKTIALISQKYNIPAQVSLEEFMGCGIGACLGCAIQTNHGYKRVCSDGPVFNAQDIIWE